MGVTRVKPPPGFEHGWPTREALVDDLPTELSLPPSLIVNETNNLPPFQYFDYLPSPLSPHNAHTLQKLHPPLKWNSPLKELAQ